MQQGWKGKLISAGAKLTIIQLVLPLYWMAIIDLSLSIVNVVAKIITNFFWHDGAGNRKCHWISWHKLCKTKEEGGLGMRNFVDIAKTKWN